jgi:hypothetical protein
MPVAFAVAFVVAFVVADPLACLAPGLRHPSQEHWSRYQAAHRAHLGDRP